VRKTDIAKDGAYELSINRYKETEHAAVEHENPAAIIAELKQLEAEISRG
jgi:type I restriction enzyme M protein